MSEGSSERRREKRLPSHQAVCFSETAGWGALCVGSVHDLSPGGMAIQTDSIQPIGTKIEIETMAGGDNGYGPPKVRKGVVCHIQPLVQGGYLLGVQLSPAKVVLNATPTPEQQNPIAHHAENLIERSRNEVTRKSDPVQKPLPQASKTERAYAQQILTMSVVLLAGILFAGWGAREYLGEDDVHGVGKSAEWRSTPVRMAKVTPEKDSPPATERVQGRITPKAQSVIPATLIAKLPKKSEPAPREALENTIAETPLMLDAPDTLDAAVESQVASLTPFGTTANPISQVHATLQRAQKAAQNGNRTAALYLSREAVDLASALPAPWRRVAQEFRKQLLKSPGAIPKLPELNNGLTLSQSLSAVPLDAPVVIYVSKSDFTMKVVKDGKVVWQFPIGLGFKDSTPEGIFTVGNKISLPEWYNKGNPVSGGDTQNPLGDSWIGLSDKGQSTPIGIHPTEKNESIGEALSGGCIRMRPADAERLYRAVPLGTPIVIRG